MTTASNAAHATKTWLALSSVVLCSACSLVKLSDEITQEHCSNDADCDALNQRTSSTFDPCELWQCSATTKYCEFSALDADHDGFSPHVTLVGKDELVCEAKADKRDCDDDNDARKPGGKERCDDQDNDCDAHLDEGVLESHVTASVAFNADNNGGTGNVATATDPTTGALALGYNINRTPSVAGFSVVSNALPAGGAAAPLQLAGKEPADDPVDLFTEGVGVAALGDGKYAAAMYDTNGRARVLAGLVDTSGDPELRVADSLRDVGLSCLASETVCTAGMMPKTLDTRTPAISALGSDVLVSYVRAADDASPRCAKSDAASSAPLLANLLAVQSDGLEEQTTNAVKVGDSSAFVAPAIVAVPEPSAGKAYGWLVAYVDENGAISVKNVRVDGAGLAVSGALFNQNNAKQRYLGVRMALGPKTDDGQVIALVFHRGCTVEARVGVVLLVAALANDGSPKLTALLNETMVGGAPNEKDANAAYNRDRDSWIVAYRDTTGVRARVLDASGKLLGSEPYVLEEEVATGGNMAKARFAPAVVPTLAAKGWFGTLTYVERAGGKLGFTAATLATCGKDN